MQFPQIRMESQMARIQIEQPRASIELRQPKADLSIEQPKADLSITTTKGKLTIDQSQAWEDMNLMSTQRSIEKNAEEGRQAMAEGTGRRAEQGTELMKIENQTNAIQSQAITNSEKPMGLIGFKYMPSVFSVKLDYEPGTTDINVQENKPIIDATVQRPELTFNRGHVDISMAQYAELHIDFDNLFPEQRV